MKKQSWGFKFLSYELAEVIQETLQLFDGFRLGDFSCLAVELHLTCAEVHAGFAHYLQFAELADLEEMFLQLQAVVARADCYHDGGFFEDWGGVGDGGGVGQPIVGVLEGWRHLADVLWDCEEQSVALVYLGAEFFYFRWKTVLKEIYIEEGQVFNGKYFDLQILFCQQCAFFEYVACEGVLLQRPGNGNNFVLHIINDPKKRDGSQCFNPGVGNCVSLRGGGCWGVGGMVGGVGVKGESLYQFYWILRMVEWNKSIAEGLHVEDGGGEADGAVVGAVGLAVSESNEGVDACGLAGEVPVGDGEEGAHDVDVDEHAVVLGAGGDVALADQVAFVQVVPVGLSVEFVRDRAFVLHVRSHVETAAPTAAPAATAPVSVGAAAAAVLAVGETHRLVVEGFVAGDGDGAVGVDDHHVLVGAEGEGDNEGLDVDGFVEGSGAGTEAVSESHKGVDLGFLVVLGPGGDNEEGAHDVAVDGEVEELGGGVHAGFVEGVGAAQVVPVLSFEEVVDVGPDVEEGDGGLAGDGGDGGVVEVGVVGGDGCGCEAGDEHEQSEGLTHISNQFIYPTADVKQICGARFTTPCSWVRQSARPGLWPRNFICQHILFGLLLVIGCKIELDGKQRRVVGDQKLPGSAIRVKNTPNRGFSQFREILGSKHRAGMGSLLGGGRRGEGVRAGNTARSVVSSNYHRANRGLILRGCV